MHTRNLLILSAVFSMGMASSAFAVQSDREQVVHHVAHKRHIVKNINPNSASDADRDAGMYIVKPQAEPEYFGHAAGSDGSMPQE